MKAPDEKSEKYIKLIIGVLIVGIVLIPLIIHCLFKLTPTISFFVAEWSAGDLLLFYGTLLAAGLAVLGVFLSIQYAQSNYREDLHNRVLPYMAIIPLRERCSFEHLGDKDDDTKKAPETLEEAKKVQNKSHEKIPLESISFVINMGKIGANINVTKKQEDSLREFKKERECESTGGVEDIIITHSFNVENVGIGAAIGCRFEFFSEKDRGIYTLPTTIKNGEKIYVSIFCVDKASEYKNIGEYVFEIHYEDIFGKKYVKRCDFLVKENSQNQIYAKLKF